MARILDYALITYPQIALILIATYLTWIVVHIIKKTKIMLLRSMRTNMH